MEALAEVLRADLEELAGKKGKHRECRTHNHWGRTRGELVFGRRRVQVERPRVRSTIGVEAALPSFEAFRREDPLPERVVNQILLGVSTRGYESSLERPLELVRSRGTSKSAASRHLVSETRKKLSSFLSSRLEEVELLALMVHGIEIAGHTVVVSLGITADGTKVPLGLWLRLDGERGAVHLDAPGRRLRSSVGPPPPGDASAVRSQLVSALRCPNEA